MVVRFLFFSLIVLLVDVYFYQSLRTLIGKLPARRKKIARWSYWGFTGFAILLLIVAAFMSKGFVNSGFQLYVFNVILVLTISKLLGCLPLFIDDLFRLGKWITSLFYAKKQNPEPITKINRSQFLSKMAIGVAAIPFVTFIYGMVKTAFDFTVRRITLKLPNLPASFDGLKIVQISDIHSGSFVSEAPFRKAIKLIDEQKPDIIFFTGDLVNNVTDEVLGYTRVLSTIKAPMGVFSTLGNHDYGDYVQWDSPEAKAANLDKIKNIHKEFGWRLLLNENEIITRNGESIAILGVENWGQKLNFPKYGKLNEAYAGTEDIPVKLLLSHDPSHWDGEIRPKYPDIDVTFSGHTHGFQFGIEIPGFKWSPSQYVYKQWAGLYQEGKQYIYVNRGFGFLGYLGRVGIPPEITVIELKRG